MPIGDLLAQISGDGSAPNPAPSVRRTDSIPKRKAADDLPTMASKAPRTTSLSTTVGPRPVNAVPRPRDAETSTPARTSQPSRPLDRPLASQRPMNGSGSRPAPSSSRPLNGANRVQKPTAPARPAPGPASAAAASRAAPKKGSFAEILARGQRAQAVMGQVGKIQHKKVEKGASAPKKDEPKQDPRGMKKRPPPQQQAPGYTGTSKAKPGQRNGTPTNGRPANDSREPRAKPPPMTKAERAKAAAAEEKAKRVKKAASATTGYTGTARPKPGGGTVKKREEHRGGALLNSRPPRPRDSRSYDDYDEDMDDFIDYDDEEGDVGGGPRYDYASDGSSDMEAGISDIDVEERRAEQIGRREDIEEERLERSLKVAKEQRKRDALETLRAGRRR